MNYKCQFIISILSIFLLIFYSNHNLQNKIKLSTDNSSNLTHLHNNKTQIRNLFYDKINFFVLISDEIILYELCEKIQKNFRLILKYLVYEMRTTNKGMVWLHIAALKNYVSFRRKLIFFRGIKLELIDDIVRGSVIFESEEAMYEFKNKLKNYYNIHEQFDNFRNEKRFKAIFLKLSDKFAEKFKNYNVLIELQLHFCGTYLVQQYTHYLYKILNNLKILTHKEVVFDDLDINDFENSIHPYFIVKSMIDKCQNIKCRITLKDVIMKENKYLIKKAKINFNQKNFLLDFGDYSKKLLIEYNQYLPSTTTIEQHKKFEIFLEKFLSDIYKTAFINKNKCDHNLLDKIDFYS